MPIKIIQNESKGYTLVELGEIPHGKIIDDASNNRILVVPDQHFFYNNLECLDEDAVFLFDITNQCIVELKTTTQFRNTHIHDNAEFKIV